MSKWIDFSLDERKAMIQGVVEARQIDEAAAEKDWWVTAVLHALFHTSVSEYLLFKGGTSLSKGWDIINRFSEDIDLALSRDYFLNVKQLSCASCTSNTQIHNLREKGQDFLFGEFKDELAAKLAELGLEVTVLTDNDIANENGEPRKVPQQVHQFRFGAGQWFQVFCLFHRRQYSFGVAKIVKRLPARKKAKDRFWISPPFLTFMFSCLPSRF